MKKSLLICAAALCAGSAMAMPTVLPDMFISAISPNGRYIVSELDAVVVLIDTETGHRSIFCDDGSYTLSFMVGNGNCVANDGTFVGKSGYSSPATIFINGQYEALPQENASAQGSANAITPDGSVICGTQWNTGADMLGSDILTVPCVWYKSGNGYTKPEILPHPDTDFTGRAPQYITAISISDDGNVIAGQIRDYQGYIMQPIVYTRNAEGDWSYNLVQSELINPNHIVFPPFPGDDGPAEPSIEQYMTEDEIKEYQEAYTEWENNCSATGVWDYNSMPEESQFISDEGIDAYDAAMALYKEAYQAWAVQYNAFAGAYFDAVEASPEFIFNNVYLSADGKTYATTSRKSVSETVTTNTPYLINADGSGYSVDKNDLSHTVCGIADNGILLAYDPSPYVLKQEFRLPDGTYQDLQQYMDQACPAIGSWVRENMYHDMEVYDNATQTFVPQENVPCFGAQAVTTPDMSTIVTNATNDWDLNAGIDYYSYIFDVKQVNNVPVLSGTELKIAVAKGGTLVFTGEAANVKVYDMTGTCCLNVDAPAATIATGLPAGLYIVKATDAAG
ncbi:MAG: hypothetical protein NC217_08815, partial [Muribaculaceae bacterium]|nr:hypothetical protein [Muribaculaceae bacterium]